MVGIRIRYKYEKLNEKPKTTINRPGVGINGIGRCQVSELGQRRVISRIWLKVASNTEKLTDFILFCPNLFQLPISMLMVRRSTDGECWWTWRGGGP